MDIYYIEIDEFKKKHDKDFLLSYADIPFKSEKRFYEYCIGRYLVKTVAKQVYDIVDSEIIKENNKPKFKHSDICFNISHSKNIVIACFDTYPCAIDIEYIKKRDLDKFSKFYNKKFDTLDYFYRFWTHKEATYKLNDKLKDYKTEKFLNNYILTVASCADIEYKILKFL